MAHYDLDERKQQAAVIAFSPMRVILFVVVFVFIVVSCFAVGAVSVCFIEIYNCVAAHKHPPFFREPRFLLYNIICRSAGYNSEAAAWV